MKVKFKGKIEVEEFKSVGAAVSGPVGGDLLLSTLHHIRRRQTFHTHRLTKSLAQTLDPADILITPHVHTRTGCS